ncbi:MAG: hypothetical protein U9O94_05830 [Nanoarchaeota archaeon]|nr:hypothetical protein [Nanoarchaeota archaeon]
MHKKSKVVELFLLIFIILLNILDFLEWLPGDIDFLKKTISWLLLAYLLYKLSLVKQFFGKRNRTLDILLILTYFLFIFKNLVIFASVAIEEVNLLAGFYTFIIDEKVLIEYTTFYLGGIMLILLSFYMTYKLKVTKPSLMDVIHERGIPKNIYKKTERFILTFLVLVGFFVIVFNLVMEWLAMAVDASLLVVALIFYVLTLFREHHSRFHPSTFIYRVGHVGEKFYEKFISLFHSKKRIFLAISGILVLHLLTDIGVFMIPYILGFHDAIYFGHFEGGHSPLYNLLIGDIGQATSIFGSLSIVWVYVFNLMAMLLLLFLPAYIWYRLFKRSGFKVSNLKLSTLFISLTVFVFSPLFRIKSFLTKSIVGVDILTHSLSETPPILGADIVLILSLGVGILVFFACYNHWIKERLIALAIISIDLFFTLYVYLYFTSLLNYYPEIILRLFTYSKYLPALYTSLFFVIQSLLFVIGFILFLTETRKEFKYIK